MEFTSFWSAWLIMCLLYNGVDNRICTAGNTWLGSQAFRMWSWQCLQCQGEASIELIGALTHDLKLWFNCLYCWHATMSQVDDQWVTMLMGNIFIDKPIDDIQINTWHSQRLGCLLFCLLPGEFSDNSTYMWFPLQIPKSMEVFLCKLGTADL